MPTCPAAEIPAVAAPRIATRDRIVAAADALFYRGGFEATSFADIAAAVGLSRGNFYHHFKSKDEILDAVITARLAATGALLARWEARGPEPAARIRSFIRMLVDNQPLILAHGCPVGTLCTELAKLEHPAVPRATELFTLFRDWLRRQFTRLGRRHDADALAMHVLARSQGIAVLANAFHDAGFVRAEVRRLERWLASTLAPSSSPSPSPSPSPSRAG